jgi:hypothetical protein
MWPWHCKRQDISSGEHQGDEKENTRNYPEGFRGWSKSEGRPLMGLWYREIVSLNILVRLEKGSWGCASHRQPLARSPYVPGRAGLDWAFCQKTVRKRKSMITRNVIIAFIA